MAMTGFLKVPDIPGESLRVDHEDEIDIHGLEWGIRQSQPAGGRGRSRSKAKVENIVVTKFTDAASPYLALACLQGKSFDEIVLSLRKDSGDAHLDYLTITMTNCQITGFDMENDGSDPDDDLVTEHVGLAFESIRIRYVVQADDHSAGNEHETEYDLAGGAWQPA